MIDNFYSDIDLDCYKDNECYMGLLWDEMRSDSYAENKIANEFDLSNYK